MLFPDNRSLCTINQSIIVSKDNGANRKHTAHNNSCCDVFQYKIDGDIIPTGIGNQRCDFLVENETKKAAYLIELKGTNVLHAIEQLEATFQQFSQALYGYTVYFRIVYRSNTHAVRSTKVTKFLRKYNGRAKIATNSMDEDI